MLTVSLSRDFSHWVLAFLTIEVWLGLASVLTSACLFLLFPYWIDALVAWTSYFAIKGMVLMAAVSSITFEADARLHCAVQGIVSSRKPEPTWGPLRIAQQWFGAANGEGYLCALLEISLIWTPQITMGLNWVSNEGLDPFLCSTHRGGFTRWILCSSVNNFRYFTTDRHA
eukprot:95291-Amphidinium_carterae.1